MVKPLDQAFIRVVHLMSQIVPTLNLREKGESMFTLQDTPGCQRLDAMTYNSI